MNILSSKINILDKGYIKYIGHMGSDESFVEAARMSTGKGFFGWTWDKDTYSDSICVDCKTHHLLETLTQDDDGCAVCNNCWEINIYLFDEHDEEVFKSLGSPDPKLLGRRDAPRDLALLNTLYSNGHATPFEMGEICIEVYAPIMVFREWHRSRTQSYNEFSARYSLMPNVHYVPDLGRIQKQSKTNKQGSAESMDRETAVQVVSELQRQQADIYDTYDAWVGNGVAKEVARINTPVSRYSKMRAKTDVRNWLGFLGLRMDMAAQFEIRQYANVVAAIVLELFPRTYDLFLEHQLLGKRFSRTESKILHALVSSISPDALAGIFSAFTTDEKTIKALMSKITLDKELLYKGIPGL